jgi:hypothetical protein
MIVTEKRRDERFTGAIQIELKNGTGIARDFNIDGIYFVTDQPMSLGEHLDFTIKLNHIDSLGPHCLRCHGKVVRVEPGLDKVGVAMTISRSFVCIEPGEAG